MKRSDISKFRIHSQGIIGNKFKKPEEVVRHLGAVQAQDYLGALWAVGLRMWKVVESDIETALTEGRIIRTWPMRGTLHFVAPEDARWILDLLSPRVIRAASLRGEKGFGLNEKIIDQCKDLIRKSLAGGKQLSRPELYQVLERGGVSTQNSRGLHILGRLALDRLICFGPRNGKQKTLVLFDEWVPKSKKLSREESLAELVTRYFTGHGPAQIQDLGWWSGLSVKDIRLGIDMVGSRLRKETVDGKVYYMSPSLDKLSGEKRAYLLPPFDEYVVGYKDRDAVLEAVHAKHVNPGANGMLSAVVVIDGQVVGTWKRAFNKNSVNITCKPFIKFLNSDKKLIQEAEEVYKSFLNSG